MRNQTINTLTGKQRLWFESYMTHGNATQAARDAGYSNPDKSGPRLLKNPRIQDAIEDALRQKVMSREEALQRLSSQARAEYAEFITAVIDLDTGEITDYARIDLHALLKDGKGHLIKAITPGRYGQTIEFYDAQAALVQIGKFYKLFTDKVEETGPVPDAIARALDEINGRFPIET